MAQLRYPAAQGQPTCCADHRSRPSPLGPALRTPPARSDKQPSRLRPHPPRPLVLKPLRAYWKTPGSQSVRPSGLIVSSRSCAGCGLRNAPWQAASMNRARRLPTRSALPAAAMSSYIRCLLASRPRSALPRWISVVKISQTGRIMRWAPLRCCSGGLRRLRARCLRWSARRTRCGVNAGAAASGPIAAHAVWRRLR